ncbi:hypothetical protein AB0N06_32275 [Streptomyces sp. NPDC051020]|uniref:hypothetical protein n=1 Tax=Streptomyces sp. NPDC051020 TaxID=3155409 RepID=UPI003415FE0C
MDGICRLCRRQASLIAGPDNKTRVDLTVAARTGHQLFIIGTLRPRGGPQPQPAPTEPRAPRPHCVPARWTELLLFETPRELRGVSSKVEHVDLPGRRLDPEGLNRPLDDYTAEAITEYLAYRHRRWPNSTNPHLLVTRNTATTATAVGTFWMDKLVKRLPVGVDQLRQDRILEEALANGADPLHLAHVFSLGAKASLRYSSAVAESEAEREPNTR